MLTATPIRCSSLPLAWKCPESQVAGPGEAMLNESGEAAECGNAFHRWIAAHVAGEELDAAALAAEHGCDPEELSMLCAMGRRALAELRTYLDQSETPLLTEVALQTGGYCNLSLTGTGDVIGRTGDTAIILDWKTGRLDSDYTHQLRGYAYAAVDHLAGRTGGIQNIVCITVWVRQGVWDVERLTMAQVASWASEMGRRLKNGRGSFNPGGHCAYCRRAADCPGRLAMVRASIADLTAPGENVIEWTPETRAELGPRIGEMYARAKLIEGACERFRGAVKADVEAHGPLPIGGGRRLAVLEVNRRTLDTAKARPVLGRYLTPEQIDEATSISAGEAERIAAAGAPKGRGAATRRELAQALDEAGAVTTTTVHQLRETKENT